MLTLKELYSDADILIINKPANLLVHKSHATAVNEPTVIDLLSMQLNIRLKAVHRLDRATSGVLLLARSSEAAAFYGKQFQDRSVAKEYIALTRGFIDDQIIDYPLKHLDKPELIQDAITSIKQLAKATLPFPCGRYPESRYSLV
ncbi:MAG: pseudouridylate synthase, partial [Proteobacteria bacterium]